MSDEQSALSPANDLEKIYKTVKHALIEIDYAEGNGKWIPTEFREKIWTDAEIKEIFSGKKVAWNVEDLDFKWNYVEDVLSLRRRELETLLERGNDIQMIVIKLLELLDRAIKDTEILRWVSDSRDALIGITDSDSHEYPDADSRYRKLIVSATDSRGRHDVIRSAERLIKICNRIGEGSKVSTQPDLKSDRSKFVKTQQVLLRKKINGIAKVVRRWRKNDDDGKINAGANSKNRVIEGGSKNPLKFTVEKNRLNIGFKDVIRNFKGLDQSDSAGVKVRVKHEGWPDILIHIAPA